MQKALGIELQLSEPQDTQNFLVLRSPDILTRQWCVGEMVTARANGVNTMLLTWPRFLLPDDAGKGSRGVKTSSADSAMSLSGWVLVFVVLVCFTRLTFEWPVHHEIVA